MSFLRQKNSMQLHQKKLIDDERCISCVRKDGSRMTQKVSEMISPYILPIKENEE